MRAGGPMKAQAGVEGQTGCLCWVSVGVEAVEVGEGRVGLRRGRRLWAPEPSPSPTPSEGRPWGAGRRGHGVRLTLETLGRPPTPVPCSQSRVCHLAPTLPPGTPWGVGSVPFCGAGGEGAGLQHPREERGANKVTVLQGDPSLYGHRPDCRSCL